MADWNKIVADHILTNVPDGADQEENAHTIMSMLTFNSATMDFMLDELGELEGEDDCSITPRQEAVIIMKAIASRARMDSEWMA